MGRSSIGRSSIGRSPSVSARPFALAGVHRPRRFRGWRDGLVGLVGLPALVALLSCSRPVQDETARRANSAGSPAAIRELTSDSPVDPDLQRVVIELDTQTREVLGVTDDDRAFGVFDVTGDRLAWIRPDVQFYGASVPKMTIALAYFEKYPSPQLSDDVRRELELMIKRSDNDLAAKYSRLVGLDFVQEVQRRYGFYDSAAGGGLWSGKHYGQDAPRRGDPLEDRSHAATVRQCLRFYHLLETGRLVNPEISRVLHEIFAAPELEFHDSDFVHGLRRRGATLIRKNGLWEDWHLDTARVERSGRVYLLAGMVQHARGSDYLSAMAAGVDAHLCGRPQRPIEYHELRVDEPGVVLSTGPAAPRVHTSQIHNAHRPFNEVLPSWNIVVPPEAGCSISLRIGRTADDSWTPFLSVGDWGYVPPNLERITQFEGGSVRTDYLATDTRFDRVQYRVEVHRAPSENSAADVRVERVALTLSDRTGLPHSIAPPAPTEPVHTLAPTRTATGRLPVPFRSQRVESPDIAGRICSPTSVSMVLEYRGIVRSTAEVAQAIYDGRHDIYGNWPRAVQAAFAYGVPGYVTRCADWNDAARYLLAGTPLIISIRAKKGQLTGAPYEETSGHLLVLTGLDGKGNATVNDPAASSPESGKLSYSLRELETVWLARGGTCYVLLPRPSDISTDR